MRRLTAIALGVSVLGACFGATLGNGFGRAGGPLPTRHGPQDQQPIDRKQVAALAPVRAPKGLGDAAMQHVQALCAFGPRHPGSPGWSQQLEYIANALQKHGLSVQRDTWTDRKELITFTNLSVTIPGKRKDRIVLGAHHDTKCMQGHPDPEHNFHFVGANDGASGVALLLELAPVLLATPRDATIELVFFDGEESLDWAWNEAARALFGSKRFVARHRDARLVDPAKEPPIAAMVLLDMVGRKDLHLQEELYSTPELRQIQWSAAVASGHQAHVFQRAEAAADDHKPFLDVGIPAVDLIDLNGNPHWHTPQDTVDNMSGKSLQITADLVLTMLPAIEHAYVVRKD
jgi:Zn-dependent M28 family amino/carboxypeptidase